MPNGQNFQPYRLPGKWHCYRCQTLKDAEMFHADRSRFNGCSSRCKECESKRTEERKAQGYWTAMEMKQRIEDIKSTHGNQ